MCEGCFYLVHSAWHLLSKQDSNAHVSQNRHLAVTGTEVKVWTLCRMEDELEERLENTFKCVNTPGPCKPLNVAQFKEKSQDKLLAASMPLSPSLLTSSRAKPRQREQANVLKRASMSITSQYAVTSQSELRQKSPVQFSEFHFLLLRTVCP